MLHESLEKRKTLLGWVNEALAAFDPRLLVEQRLVEWSPRPLALLAMGKAAGRMAAGARAALGDDVAHAMVIAPWEVHGLPQGWEVLRGSHPLSDHRSVLAGERVAAWLRALPDDMPLLVLLSGGASALVELPVAGLELDDLERINRWLLGSGLEIGTMNAIRARFSQLKRGGLLRFAGDRRVVGLVMSDVPGNRIEDIGSGPLSPIPVKWPSSRVPEWLARLHSRVPLPVSPPVGEARLECIATSDDLLQHIEASVSRAGVVVLERGDLAGDAAAAGRAIARKSCSGPPGLRTFGGETTVALPESGGKRGGRNQHLALAAAQELAGVDDVMLLAFATDGVDGNSEDAGAVVDGGTVARIEGAGLDVAACLAAADSGTALAASGDLVHTGPTGTNLTDIVLAWKSA